MVASALQALACAAGRVTDSSVSTHSLALSREYPADAIPTLWAAVQSKPRDADRLRELGVAFFDAATYDPPDTTAAPADSAILYLNAARERKPRDARTLFFLGASYELQKDLAAAIDVYRQYTVARGSGVEQQAMRARIDQLVRQEQLIAHADSVRNFEEGIRGIPPNDTLVAVPPFRSFGFPDSMGSIGIGMATLIAADLNILRNIRLVERTHFDVLMQELALAAPVEVTLLEASGSDKWAQITDIHGVKQVLRALIRKETGEPYYSGPIDVSLGAEFIEAMKAFQKDRGNLPVNGRPGPETQRELLLVVQELRERATIPDYAFQSVVDSNTAPLIGKILQARTIIPGVVINLGDTDLQVDALVVSLDSPTRETRQVSESDALENFFDLEKAVVFAIIREMGIELSETERIAIDQNRPTESLAAYMAYSIGLDWQSRGQLANAHASFARAARLDSRFQGALKATNDTRALRREGIPPDPRGERLVGTAQVVGTRTEAASTPPPVSVPIPSLPPTPDPPTGPR